MDDVSKCSAEDKKVKFKQNNAGSKKSNIKWVLLITVVSFFSSIILSMVASNILKEVDIFAAFLVILIIIFVNIIADTIGTAVTAADETPFHAMASRKLYGARQTIKLVRNADKVSNLCNDVIGDICGVISGSAGTYIIVRLVGNNAETSIVGLAITGLIACFTVGGKATGKIIAIRSSNYIVYKVGVIVQFITGFNHKKRKKRTQKK